MTDNKKTVALIAFAETSRALANESQADERWTLNWAWHYDDIDLSRIDRLFELHPREWLTKPLSEKMEQHWEWLQQPQPYPIYVQDPMDLPEIETAVQYPLVEVLSMLDGFQRGSGRNDYLTSTAPYLLLLAAAEGIERIELYGFEMAAETEYFYQKPGMEWAIGYCLGHGIEIWLPENCSLCRSKLYAYERCHMLGRQQLEEAKNKYNNLFNQVIADYNAAVGRVQLLDELAQAAEGDQKEDYLSKRVEIAQVGAQKEQQMRIYEGALHATNQFIKWVDLQANQTTADNPEDMTREKE